MTAKITLHVDPRPEFLGQVLRVTNQKSGEILEYDIEHSTENDLKRFETASKIKFLNGSDLDQRTRHHATVYFTKMLGSAKRIDVYGRYVRRRFPSTCSYKFERNRVPADGCDPLSTLITASRELSFHSEPSRRTRTHSVAPSRR